jgi:hypothetical protein
MQVQLPPRLNQELYDLLDQYKAITTSPEYHASFQLVIEELAEFGESVGEFLKDLKEATDGR